MKTYIDNGILAASTLGCEQIVVILFTVRFTIFFKEIVGRQWFDTDSAPEALWVPRLAHGHHGTTLVVSTVKGNGVSC